MKLYEGDTKLIFFFRPHGQNSEDCGTAEKAKKDAMSKAIALLAAYGTTLDNKDHGTNLIHKLLIEGRLVVWSLLCFPIPCVAPIRFAKPLRTTTSSTIDR